MRKKSNRSIHNVIFILGSILGILSLIFPASELTITILWTSQTYQVWFLGFTKNLSDDFIGDLIILGIGILVVSIFLLIVGVKSIQNSVSRKNEKLFPVIEIVSSILLIVLLFVYLNYIDDMFHHDFDAGLGQILYIINILMLLISGIILLIVEQSN